jgi:hypothetical protein
VKDKNLIVIEHKLQLRKWAKEVAAEDGHQQIIYEFIKDGKFLDVEFTFNYEESGLETYGNPYVDDINEPIEIIIKCNNLIGLKISVDSIIANNIDAQVLMASYRIKSNSIKTWKIATTQIIANAIEAEIVESLYVKANSIKTISADIVDLKDVGYLECKLLKTQSEIKDNYKVKHIRN